MHSIISVIVTAASALSMGKATPVPDGKPLPPVAPVVQSIQVAPLAPIVELETTAPPPPPAPAHPVASDSAGNAYPANPYQCTRYVKDRRPDIPNHLGDAYGWFDKLHALGWPTGLIPRAGAIGVAVSGNHVVYIEYVNADGSVHLSERNYDYQGSYRQRDAAATLFRYVY